MSACMLMRIQCMCECGPCTVTVCSVLKLTQQMVALLDELDKWITDIPPIDQPQRFGNKAFRDWFARLTEVGRQAGR